MRTQTTGVDLILFYVGYLTAKAEYKIHSIWNIDNVLYIITIFSSRIILLERGYLLNDKIWTERISSISLGISRWFKTNNVYIANRAENLINRWNGIRVSIYLFLFITRVKRITKKKCEYLYTHAKINKRQISVAHDVDDFFFFMFEIFLWCV